MVSRLIVVSNRVAVPTGGKAAAAGGLAVGVKAALKKQRGIWFAIGQMHVRLHRWKDAEEAFDKGDALATKKEDRTYLFFLRGGKRAATACLTATLARIDAAHTVFLEAIDDHAHR